MKNMIQVLLHNCSTIYDKRFFSNAWQHIIIFIALQEVKQIYPVVFVKTLEANVLYLVSFMKTTQASFTKIPFASL